ncbi:hypothetical protein F3K43_26085 [Streptomyces sp. LBUM 1476]|nr:hypothetical protein [Streptomyces sp. LBUM 1476]
MRCRIGGRRRALLPRACVTSPAGRPPPGTHARGVAETPTWLRHADAPAPCDRTHQTTRADPTGDVTQALSFSERSPMRIPERPTACGPDPSARRSSPC